MKTTLTLITIIASLFFSACANNNPAEIPEYWNPSRAANAYNPIQQSLVGQTARSATAQLERTITQSQHGGD
jgi:hypothetical protein